MQVYIVNQPSYDGACRTAPATPGLLKILFIHQDHTTKYYTLVTNCGSFIVSQPGYIDWLFRVVS